MHSISLKRKPPRSVYREGGGLCRVLRAFILMLEGKGKSLDSGWGRGGEELLCQICSPGLPPLLVDLQEGWPHLPPPACPTLLASSLPCGSGFLGALPTCISVPEICPYLLGLLCVQGPTSCTAWRPQTHPVCLTLVLCPSSPLLPVGCLSRPSRPHQKVPSKVDPLPCWFYQGFITIRLKE